jgi:hypothetical protein
MAEDKGMSQKSDFKLFREGSKDFCGTRVNIQGQPYIIGYGDMFSFCKS